VSTLTIQDGYNRLDVDTDPRTDLPYLDIHNAGEHVARIQLSAEQAGDLAQTLDLRVIA